MGGKGGKDFLHTGRCWESGVIIAGVGKQKSGVVELKLQSVTHTLATFIRVCAVGLPITTC